MPKGRFNDFPGMDAGPVDGSAKEFFENNNLVPVIKLKRGEDLMLQTAKFELEE